MSLKNFLKMMAGVADKFTRSFKMLFVIINKAGRIKDNRSAGFPVKPEKIKKFKKISKKMSRFTDPESPNKCKEV